MLMRNFLFEFSFVLELSNLVRFKCLLNELFLMTKTCYNEEENEFILGMKCEIKKGDKG